MTEKIRRFDATIIPIIDRLIRDSISRPKPMEVLEIASSERYEWHVQSREAWESSCPESARKNIREHVRKLIIRRQSIIHPARVELAEITWTMVNGKSMAVPVTLPRDSVYPPEGWMPPKNPDFHAVEI